MEEYDRLFEEQGGKCAICGEVNLDGTRLCVDHNHITGKIRRLLCRPCNSALGIFKIVEVGIKLLLKAIEYVENS